VDIFETHGYTATTAKIQMKNTNKNRISLIELFTNTMFLYNLMRFGHLVSEYASSYCCDLLLSLSEELQFVRCLFLNAVYTTLYISLR